MIPSLGRVILVNIGNDPDGPRLRPAVVCRVWSPGCVNAQVLVDGSNDDSFLVAHFHQAPASERGTGPVWLTSIIEGDDVGQWRWPPRVS